MTKQTTPPLIVAVGASAGGLEAFQEFLSSLGDAPNLAVVFVQHHDASSVKLLTQLLTDSTEMKVGEITGRTKLKPGCLYIAPPQQFLELKNGVVRSVVPDTDQSPLAAIDHFFHSLAEDQGEHAVGIVLSGAGTDGTVGLKAISDAGGLTFAQDAASAKFDSMPRSAATTGVADHVCRPSEIAAELLRYASHLDEFGGEDVVERVHKQIGEAIPRIAQHLLKVTGHNFQHYKITTLTRRIQRRMQILKIETASEYLIHLQGNEDEAKALFRELLIGVTAFFRDPEAFDALATTVLPTIFDGKGPEDIVRIWVAGCSTGEEAYSIAMLCREYLDEMSHHNVAKVAKTFGERSSDDATEPKLSASFASGKLPEVQIFATDIDERALQIARTGTYPTGIEDHVSTERLKRFFVKRGKRYQVAKEIRNRVLFSKHNLISDPPFSRQDLISCRNLLIYLGAHLQEKLIPLFHYAMRPSGFLFLGPSETISTHGELFKALDNRFRISQRKGTATGSISALAIRQGEVKPVRAGETQPDVAVDLNSLRQRIILDEFAPKAVVIDQSGQVLNASDGVSKYLTVSGGDFQNNIIKMALSGLRIGLRAAINEATKSRRKVTHENLSIRDDELIQRVMLTVQPMPQLGEDSELFLVVFHDVGEPMRREDADKTPEAPSTGDQDADAIVAQLERELETTRTDLERTLQDMDAANEEMKSSNEELLSMNEELQSANEELETSKEELLTALGQVARSERDQKNLLHSTQVATLFLDRDFHIRSFTAAATAIYNLIPTDLGRPLSHITHTAIEMPRYPSGGSSVDDLPIEDEVETQDGRWFLRRVQPYMDDDDQSDGVVVTFYEISDQKKLRMRLAAAYAVTKLLADADSFETVIPDVLKSLRKSLEAEVCALWRMDKNGALLICDEVDADDSSRLPFVNCSRSLRFALGEGLPGLVWERRQPVWFGEIQDTEGFARSEFAAACDLFSGVGTPIIVGNKFKGVIEIYTTRQLTHEPELIQLLGSVGNEIGQFIRQRRLDDRFRDQEARKTAILKSAIDCIITMDANGRIVEFNPAAERTFGYVASNVVGKSLADTIVPEEYRDSHQDGLARFLATGESKVLGQRIEITAVRVDGMRFPVELAINVSYGRNGEAFFTAYLRDITDRKQAETVLSDAKARLDLSLEVADVAPWNWDMQTRDVVSNPILNRLFGFDEDANPRLEEFVERIDASAQARITAAIEQSLKTGATYDEEYPIHWPSGEIRHVRARGQVRRSPEGNVSDFFGVVVDITQRKRRELEIADREAYLRLVIDNTLSFIAVLDPHGAVQELNATASHAIGSLREEVIGLKFWEIPCWRADATIPVQMQKMIAKAATGEAQRIDMPFLDSEQRVRTADFSLNPVFDGDGRVTHLVPSSVDITQRKELERQHQETSQRMEMALRAGGMAAWEWTPNQSFWTQQLYELLGLSSDQPASTDLFFSLVHPEDLDELKRSWQEAIDGNDAYECEFRIRRPDGQVRWMMGLGEVVRNRIGKVVRMYGLNWDSTKGHDQAAALQESERRALEASASKSAFLANMSHEIRTPMTAILGYADLIRDSIDDPEAIGHLQTIRRNGDYLLEIINDILDLSKIEANKLDIETERFQPAKLIEDVRSVMEVRATEGGISLEVEYQGKLPKVIESDAKRLKQILINLVGNAIKFTREGRVRIRVRYDRSETRQEFRPPSSNTDMPKDLASFATDGRLHFDIVDTGIGMNDEQLDRLFKPFSQGDSSVSRHFGGTGLGLAISKRLAEMLGGRIEVSSTEGVGSTFTVSIATGEVKAVPMVDYTELTSIKESPTTDASNPLPLNCHVLVVDDRRDIRFLSRTLLTRAGATVDECEDGQLAVEYMTDRLNKPNCPDLILLDMQMPNLDGYETARTLRKLGYAGPIIALTADAMQGDMNECLEAGCNGYLPKPIDSAAMLQTITGMLSEDRDK